MKRKFEFRLERVRRVRALEEGVARAERAQAESLARAAETSRDEAREVLAESRAHLRALIDAALDPARVLAAHRMLDVELVRLRRRVESARTLRIQAERVALAHRDRRAAARALDELRERARQHHELALGREENAVLDEAAQRRASRTEKRESASRSEPGASDQGDAAASTGGDRAS